MAANNNVRAAQFSTNTISANDMMIGAETLCAYINSHFKSGVVVTTKSLSGDLVEIATITVGGDVPQNVTLSAPVGGAKITLDDDILSTENAVKNRAIYDKMADLYAKIAELSGLIEYYHGMAYAVNGEQYSTLTQAINAINNYDSVNGVSRFELRKDTKVSDTDTGTLPTITKGFSYNGLNHTLTIDTVKGAKGVFDVNTNSEVSFKNAKFNSTNCTLLNAKGADVKFENCILNGSSTDSYVKLEDAAKCTIVSSTAENEAGAMVEANTQSLCATFNVKDCHFIGSTTDTMIKNTSTSTKNIFTFDGGTYEKFSYPTLDNHIGVKATFMGGDEVLSVKLSSAYTFNGSVPSDFALSVVDNTLSKWQVKKVEGANEFVFVWNKPQPVPALENLLNIRARVLSGDSCDGERFVQESDINMEDLEEHAAATGGVAYPISCGNYWDGIGDNIGGDDPKYISTNKWFKGEYDGGNHVISNLMFYLHPSPKSNEERGLFNCAQGARIKNLSVFIKDNGFDEASTELGRKYGAGAIVGLAMNGVEIENVKTYGNIGSDTFPAKHSCGGLIAVNECEDNKAFKFEYATKIISCENNINVKSSRKVGGLIGFCRGTLSAWDSVNNGTIAYINTTKTDDGIGGFVGCTDSTRPSCKRMANMKNTGTLDTPQQTPAKGKGQVTSSATTHSSGESYANIVVRKDQYSVMTEGTTATGKPCTNLSYGKILEDGTNVLLTTPVPYEGDTSEYLGDTYAVMVPATASSNIEVIVLEHNQRIRLDQTHGNGWVTDTIGNKLTGTLISGNVYEYTAN